MKEKFEGLLEHTQIIDEIFNVFNTKDLIISTKDKLAACCYTLARERGYFEREFKDFENNPNYQKAITRMKIVGDKLYKELKRRDNETNKTRK